MRMQFGVELLSKITRKNGCSAICANLVSTRSSPFLKSSLNGFHHRFCSQYSTLSRSYLCSSNGVSGTIKNGFVSTSILATRFFSNGLLKGREKIPVTICKGRLSHSFTSLDRRRRSIFRRFTSDGVVLGLIMANAAVFILWKVADTRFMRNNFMISVDNFKNGRLHTLITSEFSHIELFHLIPNMIGLYFFGTSIGQVFGPQYLLKLYLSGAIVSSVFFLAYHAFMAQSFQKNQTWGISHSMVPGLGASGAVNAIILLDIFLFPTKTLYFDLFIPMPAFLVGLIIVGHDILRVWQGDQQVSGSAHLGGATVAALAWLRNRKGRFR